MPNAKEVAALFVQVDGAYWNNQDVDAWPEQRDARLYTGPLPALRTMAVTSADAW